MPPVPDNISCRICFQIYDVIFIRLTHDVRLKSVYLYLLGLKLSYSNSNAQPRAQCREYDMRGLITTWERVCCIPET